MSRRTGFWLIAAGVGLALLFAVLGGPGPAPPVGRGTPAPDFSLPRLDGGDPVHLSALTGRVVLVNFWATWCQPCEEEMPAMERLYRALAGEGFELLAVAVDKERDDVAHFQQRLSLSFPILLDPDEAVPRSYQTFRYPESFLIGPDGVVIERYVGGKDWDAPAYVEQIRRLLRTRLPSDAA